MRIARDNVIIWIIIQTKMMKRNFHTYAYNLSLPSLPPPLWTPNRHFLHLCCSATRQTDNRNEVKIQPSELLHLSFTWDDAKCVGLILARTFVLKPLNKCDMQRRRNRQPAKPPNIFRSDSVAHDGYESYQRAHKSQLIWQFEQSRW